MNKLFHYADEYIKECDWKDLALLKFCLCAIGVFIGLQVPKDKRKPVFVIIGIIFIITYIPLMSKFFGIIKKDFTQ